MAHSFLQYLKITYCRSCSDRKKMVDKVLVENSKQQEPATSYKVTWLVRYADCVNLNRRVLFWLHCLNSSSVLE